MRDASSDSGNPTPFVMKSLLRPHQARTLSPRQRPPVPHQARLTGHAGPRRSVRPPRHVAVHEAHDLPAPRIKAKEPGSTRPARSLEETEQLMDEPGPISNLAVHRVTDPDRATDRTARQRILTHRQINSALNPFPNSYVSMNMQVGKAVPTQAPAQEQAHEAAQATARERKPADARVSRRLYLPTLVIAGLAVVCALEQDPADRAASASASTSTSASTSASASALTGDLFEN